MTTCRAAAFVCATLCARTPAAAKNENVRIDNMKNCPLLLEPNLIDIAHLLFRKEV
jgi:hypothetical protein